MSTMKIYDLSNDQTMDMEAMKHFSGGFSTIFDVFRWGYYRYEAAKLNRRIDAYMASRKVNRRTSRFRRGG